MTSVVVVGSGFTGFECAYHLYAIPRGVNRWAVALAYLTDVFFPRTLVSLGLSTQSDAEFSTSEGIPLPKTN